MPLPPLMVSLPDEPWISSFMSEPFSVWLPDELVMRMLSKVRWVPSDSFGAMFQVGSPKKDTAPLACTIDFARKPKASIASGDWVALKIEATAALALAA